MQSIFVIGMFEASENIVIDVQDYIRLLEFEEKREQMRRIERNVK